MINLSFIICTYNYPHVSRCLDSILKQRAKDIEIIIVDGGSDKETLDILEEYKSKFKYIQILHNKEKLPEGEGNGKWLGWKEARGKFVAIVDQDNELQGENWISEMLKPFSEEKIFGCACRLDLKKEDSLTNQYISLQGTDPIFAYKSLDGIINLKKIGEDKGDYLLLEIKKTNLIITGGNCFIYKKSDLDEVGGYIQDTENIAKLVNFGKNKIAIPKFARTHHLATTGFFDFIKRKKRWAKKYQMPQGEFSYSPRTRKERKALLINLFLILTIFPNFMLALKKIFESKRRAWILHPILPLITFIIYFIHTFMRLKLRLNK